VCERRARSAAERPGWRARSAAGARSGLGSAGEPARGVRPGACGGWGCRAGMRAPGALLVPGGWRRARSVPGPLAKALARAENASGPAAGSAEPCVGWGSGAAGGGPWAGHRPAGPRRRWRAGPRRPRHWCAGTGLTAKSWAWLHSQSGPRLTPPEGPYKSRIFYTTRRTNRVLVPGRIWGILADRS
jgi:hypothetical protein